MAKPVEYRGDQHLWEKHSGFPRRRKQVKSSWDLYQLPLCPEPFTKHRLAWNSRRNPVRIIIGVLRSTGSARIESYILHPSISGSTISIITSDGCSFFTSSKPSKAVLLATTFNSAVSSTTESSSVISTSSSILTTVYGILVAPGWMLIF